MNVVCCSHDWHLMVKYCGKDAVEQHSILHSSKYLFFILFYFFFYLFIYLFLAVSINVVLHSLNFFPLLYDSLDTLTFLLNLNIEIKKRAKQTKKNATG